jgi:Protein of unknown function (DUF2877)
MRRGDIISIGLRAANILETATLLRVTATFDRCFYLRTGPHFVCIGDTSIGNGPLNAVVPENQRHILERSPGETAWKVGDLVNFGDGAALSWTRATRWSTPHWPVIGQHRTLPPPTIEMLITRSPPDGLFRLVGQLLLNADVAATGPLQTRACSAVTALVTGFVAPTSQQDEQLQAATLGLIGLGPGLTPSGDDVLAGALLGLHACGQRSLAGQLGAHVATASIVGTSPLSAAFLHCAIAGETSAPLHQALSTALTNADWRAALDSLDRIGHTSGWDHLAGFLLAQTTVQPRPAS